VPSVTDPDYLRRTRTGYDLTISTYAERFHHHLRDKPLDRAMISAFAGLVGLNGNRLVADVGCGTGATTGMFRDYGLFGGLCAWYSTIHVPDDALPQAFSEFHRVLIPGGFVSLLFRSATNPAISLRLSASASS
jgi:hypothetical protein